MTIAAVPAWSEGFLVPPVDDEAEGFWEGTAAGELRLQACGGCGVPRFPPRPMCPHCQSTARLWRPVSGTGTIWSFVVPHPPLLPGYLESAPYPVITVTLDEDPALRMVGNLVRSPEGPINEVDPATIVVGEPVQVVFSGRYRPDGTIVYIPAWTRPADTLASPGA